MKNKIDEKLLTIKNLEEKDKSVDCIIYTNNTKKLYSFFVNNSQEFGVQNLNTYNFINALGVKMSAKRLIDVANLKFVDYIASHSMATVLCDVSRSILNINQVHSRGLLGKNKTIAYIDTGISPHCDFVLGNDRIIKFVDIINGRENRYDDNGHGTFVAGVGSGNGLISNSLYSGVAPDSNILSIKALSSDGEAGAFSILEAMQWVYDNKKNYDISVVCMSFGSEPLLVGDPIVKGAEMLWRSGIVVVCAAGNSGPEYQTIKSPGVSQSIITVGGINDNRNKDNTFNRKDFEIATFSSRGPGLIGFKPDIVAPSVKISSCVYSSEFYNRLNGTSVACPMIAGLCSLFLEKYPNTKPGVIKQRLLRSCSPITYNRNYEGFGLPDAIKFLF